MSNAPAPPPHTPINFVRGGASMAWSAECVKALAEAGYHPDDFGDYNHVARRNKAARRACDAADGRPVNPPYGSQRGDVTPPPTPTPHQRFLAGCESGHITQHATQSSSSDRSNSCGNVVDGWNPSAAPCMPHHGSAREEGTMHCEITRQEEQQPRWPPHNLTRGQPYPQDALEEHRRERINTALDHHRENTLPTSSSQTSGAGAQGAQPTPAQAGFFGEDVDPGAGPATAPKDATTIHGDTAAECIEQFTQQAEAAMKAEMADPATIAQNQAAAKAAPSLTQRANERQADYDRTSRQQGAATRRLDSAQQRLDAIRNDPNATRDQRRQALRERNTAIRQQEAAVQRNTNARAARDTARSEARSAQTAHCRVEQGQRIRDGQARNNPRCPGENPNLPEHQHWSS